MSTKQLADMFSDATTIREQTDRLEQLKEAFAKSDAKQDRYSDVRKAGKNLLSGSRRSQLSKSLSREELEAIDAAFADQANMQKEITAGAYPAVGYPGNLKPYDLEAPAKILVPRATPLRNELPRLKGVGGAREYRRILGYSGAQTAVAGVPANNIFFNSETTTTAFGSLNLLRPAQIEYSMDDLTVAYVEAGVSDSVSYKAQFADLGFENTRALSHMATLWSHMLGEERAILSGRGNTAQGYTGPFNSGNGPSSAVTVAAGAAGSAPFSTFAGTVTVQATYVAGVGQTGASAAQSSAVTIAAGEAIVVTTPTIPAGAFGVNYYVNVVTNTAGTPGVGSYFGLYSNAPSGTVNILPNELYNTATVPATGSSGDTTSANGYDGLLTVVGTTGLGGYINNSGGQIYDPSTPADSVGDTPWQEGFSALWDSVFASPQEVWMTGLNRASLGNWLRSEAGTAQAYRIYIPESGQDGIRLGSVVSGMMNQTTGDMVEIRVHPQMPIGTSLIRTSVLDIPDSGIGDTSSVISVQEYMGIDWPEIQLTYDTSTYWFGTLVHYAPAWSGFIGGLS